jgi:transposase-like protein
MRLSNVSLNNLVSLKKGSYRSGTFNEGGMAKGIKAFKLKPDCHCTSKYLNNLIEQDHRHIKVRKDKISKYQYGKSTFKRY